MPYQRRPSIYSFESFCNDVCHRVRLLNRRRRRPDMVWPGALLLDVPGEGLAIETFELTDLSDYERVRLADQFVPAALVESGARRFCWVMPAQRWHRASQRECLLLVFGEHGRCEAILADVFRDGIAPPRLGRWRDGAASPEARRASELFVEPLLAALEPDDDD
jgi:hypothetical protein